MLRMPPEGFQKMEGKAVPQAILKPLLLKWLCNSSSFDIMKEVRGGKIWQPIDVEAGLWSAEYPVRGWSSRTVALCLATGGLLLVSPGRNLVETVQEELQYLGQPEILLAPKP